MQKKVNVRKIAMTAILSAVATVLMFISFSLPIIPSFIKLDFSELPALIAAFSMGPVSGVVVCFIKNLVNLAMSTTGGEERSGMGFTIMESFMDRLSVRSRVGKGTTVTMRKRISVRATGAK